MQGGTGDDPLLGGTGNDTLIGGEGVDFMMGNGGIDTFVFESIADVASGSGRDRIGDFEDGLETIDLSGLGELAFGGNAAVGGGTASVWGVAFQAGRSTLIRLDFDGNGTVDGAIVVRDLAYSDFGLDDLILA